MKRWVLGYSGGKEVVGSQMRSILARGKKEGKLLFPPWGQIGSPCGEGQRERGQKRNGKKGGDEEHGWKKVETSTCGA